MANLKNAIPSSLRKPVDTSRFAYDLMARSQRKTDLSLADVRPAPMMKSQFARLPEEPEDAKLTGLTRSLTRRLLGLNMPKMLVTAKTSA